MVTGLFIFLHFTLLVLLLFWFLWHMRDGGLEAEILHPLKEGQNKLRSQESSQQLCSRCRDYELQEGSSRMASQRRESSQPWVWLQAAGSELLVHHVMPSQAAAKKPPCRESWTTWEDASVHCLLIARAWRKWLGANNPRGWGSHLGASARMSCLPPMRVGTCAPFTETHIVTTVFTAGGMS